MKALFLVPAILFLLGAASLKDEEFRGLEWLEKNRDAEGCIPLAKLVGAEEKNATCPQRVEPQIRPLTVGTLRAPKAPKRAGTGPASCCYDWAVHGNR